MTLSISQVKSKKDLKEFLDLPFDLYKNSKYWIPPLRLAMKEFFEPKHPFYEVGTITSWIAKKDNKVVGRISAITNSAYEKTYGEKCGFFGFYECINDESISKALFETAENYLKNLGMTKIKGPVSPSTNYECGTLIEGYEMSPYAMMTYNPPYHKNFIENQGYGKSMDLLAYHLPVDFNMPESIKRIAEKIQKKENISFRKVNKKNWDHEVKIMKDIYNQAWEDNWGFVPMTDREFNATCEGLKYIISEDYVQFAMVDGKEAGFIGCIPDLNQVLKHMPTGRLLPTGIFKLLNKKKYITQIRVLTLGILPKYRNLGLPSLLFMKAQELAKKEGLKDSEMGWVLENNLAMNKPILKMGGTPYKTYRIFEKTLEAPR
jgi:GNAT superfamily N-acetyltransferase